MRGFLIILLGLCSVVAQASPAQADSGLVLILPVPGPLQRGFDGVGRYQAGHRGVDLAATTGDLVASAAAGTVYFSGMVAGRPSVSIDHGNGLRSTYTPVSGTVRKGDVVAAGETIGRLANDAHCAGGCLHWGLTDGVDHYDPMVYLAVPRIRLVRVGWEPPIRREFPAASVTTAGGKPVAGNVTSRFGMRVHPITGVWKLHDGVDFGAPCGTSVVSPWAGRVTSASYHWAYGYRVIVEHAGLRTAYAHLQGLSVRAGTELVAGASVGRVGSTGLSTGCHLHWMAWRNGDLIDPLTLLSP